MILFPFWRKKYIIKLYHHFLDPWYSSTTICWSSFSVVFEVGEGDSDSVGSGGGNGGGGGDVKVAVAKLGLYGGLLLRFPDFVGFCLQIKKHHTDSDTWDLTRVKMRL